jgi:tight adherence protein C
LQVVPPRLQTPPLPDEFILLSGALVGLGLLLSTIGFLIFNRRSFRDRRMRSYVSGSGPTFLDRSPSLLRLIGALLMRTLASVFIRLLPPHQVRQISHRLILAGSPNNWRVSHFVAFKGVLTLLGAFLGWLIPPTSLLAALLLPVLIGAIGFILPEIWLNSRVRARQNQVVRALPSALDLLSISVESGLSLDAAMLEVVHKWRNPLAEEFATILADLKVGRGRREALRAFGYRTELSEVTTFVSALIQSDEIGLSVGRTLAVQADQMRMRQRQRAERLAREASVKMLFPMALLIFPAIFVVILVPAMPTIVESLSSLGG